LEEDRGGLSLIHHRRELGTLFSPNSHRIAGPGMESSDFTACARPLETRCDRRVSGDSSPSDGSPDHELKDRGTVERIEHVNPHLLSTGTLRIILRQKGFNVKVLALHVGLGVRTLERRFREQFQKTPKAWIMHERMSFAPSLMAEGLSHKQVAASLNYTCESNFCRDFKRHFGCTPKVFMDKQGGGFTGVAF
jgi:AraC-like DNA-binding protein